MLKKIMSLLLTLCLLLCLVACGTQKESVSNVLNDISETQEFNSETDISTDVTYVEEIEVIEEVSNEKETTSTVESVPSNTNSSQNTPSINDTQSPTTSKPQNTTSAKDKSLADAKVKADNKQYLEAMQILNGYLNTYSFDKDVNDKLSVYTDAYADQQIASAEKVFITPATDYEKALKIINIAIQNASDNAKLLSKKEYYQGFAPVYLSDIEPYDKTNWFGRHDSVKDIFGTVHNKCIRIEKWFTSADGTYNLDRKYNTFSMTIFGLGSDEYCYVKIYADDICIYSNTSIDTNTRPFDINLDVTGVLDLKIEMYQDGGECFGLSNVKIQKTVK